MALDDAVFIESIVDSENDDPVTCVSVRQVALFTCTGSLPAGRDSKGERKESGFLAYR